jgi:signal transduction histidine kinase
MNQKSQTGRYGQVKEPGVFSRVTSVMRGQSAPRVTLVVLLLTFILGWLDEATGWEVSLLILYAMPIVLAVWWGGQRVGFVIALCSGVVWWLVNKERLPYETGLTQMLAVVNRIFYFSVVAYAASAVRTKQDADAEYIRILEEHRQLEKDIVEVSEHEQQRIGQDLHDGLCQHLAAIGCAARVLAEELQAQQVAAAADVVMIEESIHQAVREARNLARGIFPVHVDRSGLAAALHDLAHTMSGLTGTAIVVKECEDVPTDEPEVSMHLYRIAQEAVANAVRHGAASEVFISMKVDGGTLALAIEDNGKGMLPVSRIGGEGMGLRTMRYRAQALGATLDFKPRSGGGTCVHCRMPLKPFSDSFHHEHD